MREHDRLPLRLAGHIRCVAADRIHTSNLCDLNTGTEASERPAGVRPLARATTTVSSSMAVGGHLRDEHHRLWRSVAPDWLNRLMEHIQPLHCEHGLEPRPYVGCNDPGDETVRT
jgi:hypothetical protein